MGADDIELTCQLRAHLPNCQIDFSGGCWIFTKVVDGITHSISFVDRFIRTELFIHDGKRWSVRNDMLWLMLETDLRLDIALKEMKYVKERPQSNYRWSGPVR